MCPSVRLLLFCYPPPWLPRLLFPDSKSLCQRQRREEGEQPWHRPRTQQREKKLSILSCVVAKVFNDSFCLTLQSYDWGEMRRGVSSPRSSGATVVNGFSEIIYPTTTTATTARQKGAILSSELREARERKESDRRGRRRRGGTSRTE